jgi:hypothetical protein
MGVYLRVGEPGPTISPVDLRQWSRAPSSAASSRTPSSPVLVVDMLVSPLHFRIVLTREPIDARMPALLVDALLGGIAALGAPGGTQPAGPA